VVAAPLDRSRDLEFESLSAKRWTFFFINLNKFRKLSKFQNRTKNLNSIFFETKQKLKAEKISYFFEFEEISKLSKFQNIEFKQNSELIIT
jgi:hypothetical protein